MAGTLPDQLHATLRGAHSVADRPPLGLVDVYQQAWQKRWQGAERIDCDAYRTGLYRLRYKSAALLKMLGQKGAPT
jgi:hypothetical protein